MTYDGMAALAFAATLLGLTLLGRLVAFRIPALARMRELNRREDRRKLARPRFRAAVEVNNRTGLVTNLFFYVAVLPFCLSLDPRPPWRHAAEALAVLLLFDLLYYGTHRFLFHGRALRRIHALHHQARKPTYIDALYVHPLETFIGLLLFLGSIPGVAWLSGARLSAFSMAAATLVFTVLNQVNHTFVDLPRFPFRTLDRTTKLHAAHHVDMNRGNFATLFIVYDWLFGTFEAPVGRRAP